MFHRVLTHRNHTFFLFGPRATGKSTWLQSQFPEALYFDLLQNDLYFELSKNPSLFRERVEASLENNKGGWVIVDEIQRLPLLLNEVQFLIGRTKTKFALSGSSARKLKRGQANLLAGRALVHRMFPLVRKEYGEIPIETILRFGTLPAVLNDTKNRVSILEAYSGTYLREEIKEEALTRKVDSFSRFLEVAALSNGQVTNLSSIARDSGVPRPTVTTYFEILEDTLLGTRLKAYTPRARIKEVSHPKFYFFDPGVLRSLQGRIRDRPTPEELGFLLETYLFSELNAAINYLDIGGEIYFWRTPDQTEVDFIWERGKKRIAIEVKSSKTWKTSFDKGLRSLASTKAKPTKSYGVYFGNTELKKEWGRVLPVGTFLDRLWKGEILA